MPGIRLFHRNAKLVLGGLLGGVLIEGFSTNISKSFVIIGRLRDQGVRRLKQNNRHLAEVFLPSGLDRDGDGWKLSVRLRLVHAQIRHLLRDSEDWDTEAWGVPLSAAHMGFAITAFSARLLKHMRSLGARYNTGEPESFMAIWRYVGYLMGIPETILFRDWEDALEIFEIGLVCEPPPSLESIIMANALINSAPTVLGEAEPEARRHFARHVYKVSHALIGPDLSKQLRYPVRSSFGTLPWFGMGQRYLRVKESALGALLPGRFHSNNFLQFNSLIDAAAYDEAGISYNLPDHVYAGKSSGW